MLSSSVVTRSVRNRFFSNVSSADYMILGAGSAGCVLGSRLSEDGKDDVAVLEAGPSDINTWDWWKIAMPSALTYNLGTKKFNWDFRTVPQKQLNNRVIHQPRGRVLGGSSSLNAMVYIRGHALDYERWVEEGATGWSYSECLPYFKKAQCHEGGENDYRGGDGPLNVTNGKTLGGGNELFDVFVRAANKVGYAETDDLNGYRQEGFGKMDQTVSPNGVRCSASRAYLRSNNARDNLTVQTNCVATRILFEGSRAVGVEYVDTKTRETKQFYANKEVILSLGAVGSPHLLMLSGVGDADELRKHDVDITQHLPDVGQNLQDHLEFYQQFLCKKPVTLYPVGNWLPYPHKRVMVGIEWFLRGTGWGASNQFETGGFIRSRAGVKHPDVQYHFIPGAVVGQLDFLPHHAFQAHCGTMRPTSRGTIKLNSKDPFDAPLIDPNYLNTPEDMVDLRNAFRLTEEIIYSEPFDEYRGESLYDINVEDDHEVDQWIRENSHSAYHPSCTCSMGSVVDTEGRVLGLDSLRVVDASIMPSMVSGNLNAPTIMIAEKISDTIRGMKPLKSSSVEYYVNGDWESCQR